ncbi:52 kDa repressor of the inhibitor of the protein kinase-like [Montipora capricornis]|uniref:52 kDa repressor of the inhibitor of the protein kinase-like n=1 Tax=Montipora capricornis TaxID=246305 RepID=UPI0035F136F7
MADESSDVSMTEQLAVCIRHLNASSDDEVSVNEVFLGFVELPTTDASTITDSLLRNLSKWGLDTERLRGMGFDGASNMSGTQSGVQARITQRYPKAKYFTHCSSHCLNLVIVVSCNKIQEIKNFMTTFQELSSFFSYSPKRKEILKQNFSTSSDAEDLLADCPKEEHEERLFKSALNRESLPTLSDTRWLSRVDSIHQYASRQLLKDLRRGSTAGLRTEEKFGKLYARAVKVAQTIEVLPSKPRTTVRQMHRANAPAESIPDFYRLNYYYPFLDHVIQHMNDRFPEALKGALQGTLLIPSPLKKLSTSVEEAIKKEFPEDLPMPQSFEHEVIRWKFAQQDNDSITSLPESVASCDERLYPNISTIFQLLLTLPVGSCSCERSFSALRRLKTWCRSSMASNRLNGLALAYVHSEIHIDVFPPNKTVNITEDCPHIYLLGQPLTKLNDSTCEVLRKEGCP